MTETPLTLTIVHDASDKLLLCIGLRHRFDIINVKTKQVTLLKNIVTYRVSQKSKLIISKRIDKMELQWNPI